MSAPTPDGAFECGWCDGAGSDSYETTCSACNGHGVRTSEDYGEARCPWCGLTHGDMFEHHLEDGQSANVPCSCGKDFRITASITYTLDAVRIDDGAIP